MSPWRQTTGQPSWMSDLRRTETMSPTPPHKTNVCCFLLLADPPAEAVGRKDRVLEPSVAWLLDDLRTELMVTLPPASRLNMMDGRDKWTARRMWHSPKSAAERQSSNVNTSASTDADGLAVASRSWAHNPSELITPSPQSAISDMAGIFTITNVVWVFLILFLPFFFCVLFMLPDVKSTHTHTHKHRKMIFCFFFQVPVCLGRGEWTNLNGRFDDTHTHTEITNKTKGVF